MNLKFTLADKISMTIIVVGLFGVMLVYYISDSYKNFAYQHHSQAIAQLARLQINDLIDDLKSNSLELAMAIEQETQFQDDVRLDHIDGLTQQLDNQFHQYFVTAGVLKLLKLYILDNNFTLLTNSTEGVKTTNDGELVCPKLSQLALVRIGAERLQTLSRTCLHQARPVFASIVPFGGLNPKGYIQVVTDLAYNLRDIEQALAMPIQISALDHDVLYQSKNWASTADANHLVVNLPYVSDDKINIMDIAIKSDMTSFNMEISQHRNWIMALAFVTTALTVFIVLLILQRSTIPSLAKIHDVLEKIHTHAPGSDNKNSRLLFEQLLEQMISLRRKHKIRFSVMVLDLTQFKTVNERFGNTVGDLLLLEVEQRLGSILRDSDLISWVGTDTPGHKLLPSDTKTQYRATIARLGGDEFGLLLPSSHAEEQAIAVANRIVETLSRPFNIQDHPIEIGCKIGISIYPIHGEDEKVLIRAADKAMFDAKTHQQTVFVYAPMQNADIKAAS